MVAPMQSGIAEAIDGVLNTFGPFVVPVALFAAGVVGYLFLVTIGRAGVDEGPTDDARRSSDGGGERERGREAPSRDDESDRSDDV